MEQLFLPLILPFLALVIGASAIGEERDDATILYLASTPLPRLAIVAARDRRGGAHDDRAVPAGAAAHDRARARRRQQRDDRRLGARVRGRGRVHVRRGLRRALAARQAARRDRPHLRALLGGLDRDVRAERALALARRLRARHRGGRPALVDRRERAGDQRARRRSSCSSRSRPSRRSGAAAGSAASSCPRRLRRQRRSGDRHPDDDGRERRGRQRGDDRRRSRRRARRRPARTGCPRARPA